MSTRINGFAPNELIAGRYRINKVLGQGGMGIVYQADHEAVGRQVALKVLKSSYAERPDARLRFQREARIASRLDHPCAVSVYDFGEHEGRLFLAMELVRGKTLRRTMDDGIDLDTSLVVMRDVVGVLRTAHAMGLIHRDLKPENIFVSPSSRTGESVAGRVVDFGLAVAQDGADGPRFTVDGDVLGTPEYLSPEQARGEPVGTPTDVYALGCILYELLSGGPPFTGTKVDVLTKQLFAPPPPLSPRAPVSTHLAELVIAMLDKEPTKRPDVSHIEAAFSALGKGRERARDARYLGAREDRMVEGSPEAPTKEPPAGLVRVAVIGEIDSLLHLTLAANGLVAFGVNGSDLCDGLDALEADAVYAPGASVEEATRWVGCQRPVICAARPEEMTRMQALLRQGVAEVAIAPVRGDQLARQITRAVKRSRR